MRHRPRVYPSSAISLSKSATADLDAQARNPYSRSWLWIPGSLVSLAPRNDGLLSPLQMPLHLRPRLQRRALPGDNLGEAFRRKIHVDEAGRGVGDLVILRDSAVRELHDRDALEHRARS